MSGDLVFDECYIKKDKIFMKVLSLTVTESITIVLNRKTDNRHTASAKYCLPPMLMRGFKKSFYWFCNLTILFVHRDDICYLVFRKYKN